MEKQELIKYLNELIKNTKNEIEFASTSVTKFAAIGRLAAYIKIKEYIEKQNN